MHLTAEDADQFVGLAHAVVNQHQWSEEDHDDLVQCALLKLVKALEGGKEVHNPKNFASVVFRRAIRSYHSGHFQGFKPTVEAHGRKDPMFDRRGLQIQFVEHPDDHRSGGRHPFVDGERVGSSGQRAISLDSTDIDAYCSRRHDDKTPVWFDELENQVREELGHQHAVMFRELLSPSEDLIEEAVDRTNRMYSNGKVAITRSMVAEHLGMTTGPFYRRLKELKEFLADQTDLVVST